METKTEIRYVDFLHHFRLVSLTDGNMVSPDIQCVLLDIIDGSKIYDIRPVNFQEFLAINLGFQVLDGVMGNVFFICGYKLHVIAHAFNIEDFFIFQPDEFSIDLDENMISGIGIFLLLFYSPLSGPLRGNAGK